MHNFQTLFFLSFEKCFDKNGYNFYDVNKMATLGLLQIKVFWNRDYDVIVYVHDVISKILSLDSDYIVAVVMWSKFCNPAISLREVIITLTL